MKYIRTKDNVFESEHPSKIVIQKEIVFKPDGTIKTFNYEAEIKADEILAQADSIVEVCDYIRFKTNDGETHYISLKKYSIEMIVVQFDGKKIELDSVRYCIETDKGLIYVAKLNEEG